jgi:anti-sigma B factor antagonist
VNMTIDIRQADDVTIVDISGRIELGEESLAVHDMVCDLLSKDHKQILLNLGGVDHIDSVGLGSLSNRSSLSFTSKSKWRNIFETGRRK